jgi:hypothetical protein
MNTRLLAIALLVPAALFVISCSSDDKKDSQSNPGNNAQGVPTVIPLTTGTPETRLATPNATVLAAGTTTPSATGSPGAAGTPSASGTPGASSSASGSTVTVPFPFENAVQARESLLGNARFGPPMDDLDKSDPVDLKAYPGWARTYPTLRLVGSGVNATPQTVSVYRNVLQDKQTASASNPKVIVFTVMDTKGACAAGVIRGFPTYSDYAPVDIGSSPCNASAAVAVLRK